MTPRAINLERRKELDELVVRLGIPFKNLSLLDQATTHKSYAAENAAKDNERLEFFGDAVLKFVVAEYIYSNFPKLDEGDLTEICAVLVSAKTLEQVGDTFGLDRYIQVGRGVPVRGSLVARSMEAVLGAVYLDSKFKHIQPFIVDNICSRAADVATDSVKDNFKAQLQQFTQGRAQGTPVYSVVSVEGPPHDPIFHVAVSVADRLLAQGEGKSKKAAEQDAARAAFDVVSKE